MNDLKTGEVISKRRKELGLTQNQLAQKLNLSFQAVSKWENGSAYPDITSLPKLAAALNTTVDALLGYSSVETDYDRRYSTEGYYWGLMPNRLCYDIMKFRRSGRTVCWTSDAERGRTPSFLRNVVMRSLRSISPSRGLKRQKGWRSTTRWK